MSGLNSYIQTSGAAGELAPALRGRVDLAKYRVGYALVRNFFVLASGGLATRPGSAIVGRCKQHYGTPPRDFPFSFNTLQTYILEFGANYMRVVMDGGYVLEPFRSIPDITQANPGVFHLAAHGFAVGDQLFLADMLGMPSLNSTAGFQVLVATVPDANHFTATDLDGNPINTAAIGPYTGFGFAARVFTLATPYAAADLPLLKYAQDADVMTLTHPAYQQRRLTRTQHWVWTLAPITFAALAIPPVSVAVAAYLNDTANPQFAYQYAVTAVTDDPAEESVISAIVTVGNQALDQTKGISNQITWVPDPAGPVPDRFRIYATDRTPAGQALPTILGLIGESVSCSFQDQNFAVDYTQQPPDHRDPFAVGAGLSVRITAGGASYAAPIGTVTGATGAGMKVRLYQNAGVVTNGQVIEGGHDYTAAVLTITDGGAGAGAAGTLAIGALTGTWPGCCSYYSGRALFAASTNSPQTLWATQTGNYSNMDVHDIVRDDDAITATLISRQVNAIKHLVSLNALLALTSSGAWQISGGSSTAAFTPSTVQALPQAFSGCSDVPPITAGSDILYIDRGFKVRDLTFNLYVNVYTGTDLTVLAAHLFYGYAVTEWCYAEQPFYQIQAVRDDGQLLAFTYLKEQDVYGWSHYDTDGRYISIASIVEGQDDAVYQIVERSAPGVNGGRPVYWQERQASRNFYLDGIPDVTLAWCVDAGVRYGPSWVDAGLMMAPAAAVMGSTDVLFTADADAFNNGMVALGYRIKANSGDALVTGFIDARNVLCTILAGFRLQADDPAETVERVLPVHWACTQPISVLTGLQHLEGKMIVLLVDGGVQGPMTVTGGQVTLDNPGTIIVGGLGYQCQLETMPIDIGQPVISAKVKKIPFVALLVQDTRGLKVGKISPVPGRAPQLREFKDRNAAVNPTAMAVPLITGLQAMVIDSNYQTDGQLIIQQDGPLPATVLAIVPRMTVGDDDG